MGSKWVNHHVMTKGAMYCIIMWVKIVNVVDITKGSCYTPLLHPLMDIELFKYQSD